MYKQSLDINPDYLYIIGYKDNGKYPSTWWSKFKIVYTKSPKRDGIVFYVWMVNESRQKAKLMGIKFRREKNIIFNALNTFKTSK